jgi:hypothetical protein
MNAHFEQASFKLSGWKLPFFSIGLIVFSLCFLLIVVIDSPHIILVAAAYLAVGSVYFYLRRAWLGKRGVSVQALIRSEVEETTRELERDPTLD